MNSKTDAGRAWALEEIRAANEAAGYDFFGRSEQCGNPPHYFRVILNNGRWWIEQIDKGRGRHNGMRVSGHIGDMREFFPNTGFISSASRRGDTVFEVDRRPSVAPFAD